MRFTRFLRNPSVSAKEMALRAAQGTAARVTGRDILVVQDTSELALGAKRARANGYGPIGKGGGLGGLLLHAALAIDRGTGALLGLAHADVWNREGGERVSPKRSRLIADKESRRWLDVSARAGELLTAANSITVVSDRDSDIYDYFAKRPSNVDLIVRACQNRKIVTEVEGTLLFSFIDNLVEKGRFVANIPTAPGRKERVAKLAVRYSTVELRRPQHATRALPETIAVALVDVREVSPPADAEPIHWRLLTTVKATKLSEARQIIDCYRMRWNIEEFFRTLKTAGFNIEQADISEPRVMINFVAAATVAAVTIMQLVKARDGTTHQPLTEAFEIHDQPILESISSKLAGATERQQNPHPPGSLAFAAWVIARLGGWDGYYGKPGPKVMRRGLDDFRRIKFGFTLRFEDV
jgi:hypothetical protein